MSLNCVIWIEFCMKLYVGLKWPVDPSYNYEHFFMLVSIPNGCNFYNFVCFLLTFSFYRPICGFCNYFFVDFHSILLVESKYLNYLLANHCTINTKLRFVMLNNDPVINKSCVDVWFPSALPLDVFNIFHINCCG